MADLLQISAKAAGAGEMLNIHDLKAAYEMAIGHETSNSTCLPRDTRPWVLSPGPGTLVKDENQMALTEDLGTALAPRGISSRLISFLPQARPLRSLQRDAA